jgi:ATP dependent DNA ligase-like protein
MSLPRGFVPPCLPIKAPQPPTGDAWLHEIKHDGFRVIARKDGTRIRLYSRPGNDLTYRFPLIVEALGRLRSRSCIIDGEAVACDDDGSRGAVLRKDRTLCTGSGVRHMDKPCRARPDARVRLYSQVRCRIPRHWRVAGGF